jgi:hypothetical protein
MSTRYDRARFHTLTGPEELFERVRFVLDDSITLEFEAEHANERAHTRDAPLEKLKNFDQDTWELMTAEVRIDKAKFTRTGWRTSIHDRYWWVVRGFEQKVITVFQSDKIGFGDEIVTSGPLYERVAEVNSELMDEDTDV